MGAFVRYPSRAQLICYLYCLVLLNIRIKNIDRILFWLCVLASTEAKNHSEIITTEWNFVGKNPMKMKIAFENRQYKELISSGHSFRLQS